MQLWGSFAGGMSDQVPLDLLFGQSISEYQSVRLG